jgi:Predicted membrane protein/domain
MLFRDLSSPEIPSSFKKERPSIASPGDRFLALVIDFLIMSPVVSLLGAGLLKKSKALFMLNPQSAEGLFMWVVFIVMAFFITSFLQSVFWLVWQGTPGQIFMQLRVITYPGDENKRLSYPQCFLRAVLWNLSIVMVAVPFLDVLGHPLRRALHERASDTMVVTLKNSCDPGPVAVESRFIGTWMRFFFVGLGLVAALFVIRSVDNIKRSVVAKTMAPDISCRTSAVNDLEGAKRLDTALSLFLLDQFSPECLKKEADVAIWTETDPNLQGLAYLAKSLTVEDMATQTAYVEKACEISEGEVCTLAKFLADEEAGKIGSADFVEKSLLSTQVVTMQTDLERGHYVQALKDIEEVQKEEVLRDYLDKIYVRAIWSLREDMQKASKSRVPASAEENEFIERFKDKYGVQ